MARSPAHKAKPTAVASAVAAQPQSAPQRVSVQTTQVFHGPLPHPDILRQFDELAPGAAQRIIAMAEHESEHRRLMESKALNANIATQAGQLEAGRWQSRAVFHSDMLGQVLGAVVSLCCVGAAVHLAVSGQPWVAGVLAGLPLAAIIKAFRDKAGATSKP